MFTLETPVYMWALQKVYVVYVDFKSKIGTLIFL